METNSREGFPSNLSYGVKCVCEFTNKLPKQLMGAMPINPSLPIEVSPMNKSLFKKSQEELQEYLQFKRRGSSVKPKKGKGSFTRKLKHKGNK